MVYVLLGTGFEETEAIAPVDLLRRAGVKVTTVGINGKIVKGSHGIGVEADITLAEADFSDLEMIVLPGGLGGVASCRASKGAMDALEQAWKNGKYVAAICAGPTVLADLGITHGKTCTCYPGCEDGMGGANAGEVASKILTDHFTKKMKKINFGKMTIDSVKKTLTEVIRGANEKIYKKATSKKALSGMGTTVVAGVLFGEKLIAANVGDSRAYISHKSRLEIVTEDHTFVHDLFRSGAISATEEKNHPSKHILTRAVGVHSDVEVDTYICDFPKDAVLLLCSDGLTNMIEEPPMQRLIRRHKNMEKLSDRLVAVANEKGGQDNITVIVARRQEEVTRE